MQPGEARVLIIDDDASKIGRLTEFVEANGGQVVGSVDNRTGAHQAVNDPGFPTNVGNPNVVLIDGNLEERSTHGSDGRYVFLDGYGRAILHRADSKDTLGAVAIGCSNLDDSEVAFATGANLGSVYSEGAAERWVDFLEPHPAEPDYLPEGAMERKSWTGGFRFGEIMKHLLNADLTDGDTDVTVHSLSVRETKKVDGNETVTYSDDITDQTDLSFKDLIARAEPWQGVEDGYIKVDSHTIRGIIQVDGYVYVISYSARVVRGLIKSDLSHQGDTDKISIAAWAAIPDSYWENIGIQKPEINT